MANCERCGKFWNSWGAEDEFCSDDCEYKQKLEYIGLSHGVLSKLSDEEKRALYFVLLTSLGLNTLVETLDKLGVKV